jgi:HD-GYP domain-containing protein (c-di-GMP phosphodiesterase class II)
MSFEEAQAILRDGGGSQWDPAIVNLFLEMLTERPELQGEDAFHHGDGLILPDHARRHTTDKVVQLHEEIAG